MKAALWSAGALIAAPLVFLSLLPPLFGKAPALIVSPVDQSLCALDPDGSAGIIAGGDSRALYHIVPSIIEEKTGRKCVNVAQWLHLGGDHTTFVNVLRRHPEALDRHPTVILSVTVDGLNDLGFKGIPMVAIFNWSLRDHFRVAWERQKAYPLFFFTSLVPAAVRRARQQWRGEDFACGSDLPVSSRLLLDRGFTPYEGRKTTGFWHMPYDADDYLLDGGQWKNLQGALDWLSASPAARIVLLNAPIDTAWLRASDGAAPIAMEERFSDMLAKEAARHSKVTLLDFYRHPLPELADSLFYDQTHLNHQGAVIFSRRLGGLLAGMGN